MLMVFKVSNRNIRFTMKLNLLFKTSDQLENKTKNHRIHPLVLNSICQINKLQLWLLLTSLQYKSTPPWLQTTGHVFSQFPALWTMYGSETHLATFEHSFGMSSFDLLKYRLCSEVYNVQAIRCKAERGILHSIYGETLFPTLDRSPWF